MRWTWNPYWRHPGWALLATVLPLLIWLSQWSPPELTLDPRTILESDLHGRENYDRVQALVTGEVVALVSLECDALFTPQGIDAVRRVSEALERLPGSTGVKSLTHAVRPVREGFGFAMVPLVSADPDAAELEVFRAFCLEHPLVRNVLVSPDERHALILATFEPDSASGGQRRAFCSRLEAALDPFRSEGLGFRVLAQPWFEEQLLGMLRRDALRILPLAVVLTLGVLGWHFRSAGVLVLVVAGLGVPLALLPLFGLSLGLVLDPYSLLLVPLLAAVHLSLQVHCFDAWQRAGLGENPTREALATGLDEVFRPALFALLTTGIGLASLAASPVPPVRLFGLWGALGAGLILVTTFGPGLAVILILPRRWLRGGCGRGRKARGLGIARWVERFLGARRVLVICGTGVVLVATAVGLGMIRTDVRLLEFLSPKSEARQAVEEFDRVYGGVNVLTLEVDSGAAGGVNRLAFLRYLSEVVRHATEQPGVTAVYSYDQVLAMANEIWEGGRPGSFRLPDSPGVLGMITLALRGFDFPLLSTLVDSEFRTATWVVRTPEMPSRRYLELVDKILALADARRPEGVQLSSARGVHAILESDRRILSSQLWSSLLSLGAIGLALLSLWRSWRLTALALLATVLPVAVVLGGLGFSGTPLNSLTVMVGAVCLGIAVDHSVHFLTHWRDGCRDGLSSGAALDRTLRLKGTSITVSTWVLSGTFGLLLLCSFPPVAAFGVLTAGAFLLTWATVLFGLSRGLSRG